MNVGKEVRKLRRMNIQDLRGKYLEVFGKATACAHRGYLERRIIWQIQANKEGGLSERAIRKAEELCREMGMTMSASGVPGRRIPVRRRDPRLPMSGTILTREYRGKTISIMVLDNGFEYEGKVYRSLTRLAQEITGAHWNGFDFLGLSRKARAER